MDKYKDKSSIIKHAKVYIDEIMPLFDLPINIRKYVYTNNIVESVNSKIQRGFYGRGALPKAAKDGDVDYGSVMAGQIAGLIHKEQSCREIIEEMFSKAEEAINRFK